MSLSSPGTVRVPEHRDFSTLAEHAVQLQIAWETHTRSVGQSLPAAVHDVARLLFDASGSRLLWGYRATNPWPHRVLLGFWMAEPLRRLEIQPCLDSEYPEGRYATIPRFAGGRLLPCDCAGFDVRPVETQYYGAFLIPSVAIHFDLRDDWVTWHNLLATLPIPRPLDDGTHDWDWTRHQRVICTGGRRFPWPAGDCGTLAYRNDELVTPSDGTAWLGADLLASLARRVRTLPSNALLRPLQVLLCEPLIGYWGGHTYFPARDERRRIARDDRDERRRLARDARRRPDTVLS